MTLGGTAQAGGSSDITLGEVYRRLESLEHRVEQSQAAADDRLARTLTELVRRDVWQVEHQDIEARVGALERLRRDALDWQRNLLIAVVASLLASLGAVVAALVH